MAQRVEAIKARLDERKNQVHESNLWLENSKMYRRVAHIIKRKPKVVSKKYGHTLTAMKDKIHHR